MKVYLSMSWWRRVVAAFNLNLNSWWSCKGKVKTPPLGCLKTDPVSVQWGEVEVEWVVRILWTFWRAQKCFTPVKNGKTDRSFCSQVTTLAKISYKFNLYPWSCKEERFYFCVITFCEKGVSIWINPSKAELNPICHLLALLGAHPILHVSRIRVNFNRSARQIGAPSFSHNLIELLQNDN